MKWGLKHKINAQQWVQNEMWKLTKLIIQKATCSSWKHIWGKQRLHFFTTKVIFSCPKLYPFSHFQPSFFVYRLCLEKSRHHNQLFELHAHRSNLRQKQTLPLFTPEGQNQVGGVGKAPYLFVIFRNGPCTFLIEVFKLTQITSGNSSWKTGKSLLFSIFQTSKKTTLSFNVLYYFVVDEKFLAFMQIFPKFVCFIHFPFCVSFFLSISPFKK